MSGAAVPVRTDTVEAVLAEGVDGPRLRAVREWLSTGQENLSSQLGVNPAVLADLEASAQDIPAAVAGRLVELVGAALDLLTDAELRAARERLGLNPDELSAHLPVHPRRLRRLEAGQQTISAELYQRLVDLLERHGRDVAVLEEHLRARRAVSEQDRVLWTARADEALAVLAEAGDPVAGRAPTASWHRSVAARVAEMVPGTRLRYVSAAGPRCTGPSRW